MHEHTIPESLIEQIRTGKAALVVGAGVGVPSWKQLLERMTKALETRGREGDDAATKDLDHGRQIDPESESLKRLQESIEARRGK